LRGLEAPHDAGRLRQLSLRPAQGAGRGRTARASGWIQPAGHPACPGSGGDRGRVSEAARAGAEAVLGGRREQTKAQNRATILHAAREVFAELGYDAAGVRDISRRTDLASGTFYNYFP